MGTIAEDVAAFESDIEGHIARLNADKRWYGANLSLAEVDALGQDLNKTLGIVLMLYGHACCIEDSLISVDGAGRYLVRVRPYSSGEEEEYYGTTMGRALVQALLDVWRMADEKNATAGPVWRRRKAEGAALEVLALQHHVTIDEMIDMLTKGGRSLGSQRG